MRIKSQKKLAVILSQIQGFEKPKFELEQYQTEAEIAAEVLWNAFYRREIEEKLIADLGCGTGILGLGLLILGAKKVYFVDIDEKAIDIAKKNLKYIEDKLEITLSKKAEFIVKDIKNFYKVCDVIVQNPPFGIKKERHLDRVFLKKAFDIADVIYSFHKAESKKFINAIAKDNGFEVKEYWEFRWPLKRTMKYHKKKIKHIAVGCWRLTKQ